MRLVRAMRTIAGAGPLRAMLGPEEVYGDLPDSDETLFARLPGVLEAHAVLAIYGPFRYGGAHTSASNAAFDASLRARDPASGIRDFETIDALAAGIGLRLIEDFLAKSSAPACSNFREVAEMISKVAPHCRVR